MRALLRRIKDANRVRATLALDVAAIAAVQIPPGVRRVFWGGSCNIASYLQDTRERIGRGISTPLPALGIFVQQPSRLLCAYALLAAQAIHEIVREYCPVFIRVALS